MIKLNLTCNVAMFFLFAKYSRYTEKSFYATVFVLLQQYLCKTNNKRTYESETEI